MPKRRSRRSHAGKNKNNSLKVLILTAAACLLLVLTLGITALHRTKVNAPSRETIARGVTIAGIDVGGMTREEAQIAVLAKLEVLPMELTVVFPGGEYTIPQEISGLRRDFPAALTKALYCSEGTAIEPELLLDTDRILAEVTRIAALPENCQIPSDYYLEGEIPDLTLVLETGRSGIRPDGQMLTDAILEAWRKKDFRLEASKLGQEVPPDVLDPEAIRQTVTIAPQAPALDRETLTVTPGENGYSIDTAAVQSALDTAGPGETLRIPCIPIPPEGYEDDVWFPDVLGRCRTPHTDNENRNDNLRLACEKLNGLILEPGQTLSYNTLLGERTTAKGYKPAPAYSGTELVDEIGGGICQVSSTLYLSSLLAELKTVSRTNHGFAVDYIPIGLDAAVNWNTTDLKIQNGYPFPVKITAEVTDEDVLVEILGIETRDYYVRIEHVVEGPRYASAYLCHFDPETDKEISRVLDHASLYLDIVWQWPDYADNERIVTYR